MLAWRCRRPISAPAPAPSWTILRAAAAVLRGRRVAAGVKLMVAPASLRDQNDAEREGVLQTLLEAGAQLLPTSCGACAGYGSSIPDGATVISTTARNFKGRMGSETAQVYLASPYSVAAAAATGRIIDPRGGAAMNQHGRVWRVGADIDTDALAPGAYMKFGIDEIARHCLQRVRTSPPACGPATCWWPGPTSASAPRANRPPPPGPAGRGGGGGAVL